MTTASDPLGCPSWCNAPHAEAMREGVDAKTARRHARVVLDHDCPSIETGGEVRRSDLFGVALTQAPIVDVPGFPGRLPALVRVELPEDGITSSEARTLAAALLRAADLLEMEC